MWLALLVVVLSLVIVYWLGASEFQIRCAGLVLQWCGLDGVGTFDAASVCKREHAWKNVDPDAPIQEQVDALKNNVESLKQQLTHMHVEMDSRLHGHSESLRQEQESRKEGDERLHQRLEAAETGGIYVSFIGVVWLSVGLLLRFP